MQPQENPCRVLLGLHGDSTEGFLVKNLLLFRVYGSQSINPYITDVDYSTYSMLVLAHSPYRLIEADSKHAKRGDIEKLCNVNLTNPSNFQSGEIVKFF